MDRSAWFLHIADCQYLDQAVNVANRDPVNLNRIENWAKGGSQWATAIPRVRKTTSRKNSKMIGREQLRGRLPEAVAATGYEGGSNRNSEIPSRLPAHHVRLDRLGVQTALGIERRDRGLSTLPKND